MKILITGIHGFVLGGGVVADDVAPAHEVVVLVSNSLDRGNSIPAEIAFTLHHTMLDFGQGHEMSVKLEDSGALSMSLSNAIIAAIAVLNFIPSISSLTFLMVR